MNWETNRIAVGSRFKISKLGAVRCPNLAGKIGIVVAGPSQHRYHRAVRWRQKTDLLARGLYIFNT